VAEEDEDDGADAVPTTSADNDPDRV